MSCKQTAHALSSKTHSCLSPFLSVFQLPPFTSVTFILSLTSFKPDFDATPPHLTTAHVFVHLLQTLDRAKVFFCLFVLVSCLTYANMCHTFNYFCMRFTLQLNLPPTTFAVSTLGLANDGSSFKQKQLIPFHRQTHTHAHKPTKNT